MNPRVASVNLESGTSPVKKLDDTMVPKDLSPPRSAGMAFKSFFNNLASSSSSPTTATQAIRQSQAKQLASSLTSKKVSFENDEDDDQDDMLPGLVPSISSTVSVSSSEDQTTASLSPVVKTTVKIVNPAGLSPQAYLDALIRSRGYLTKRYKTLQTGYYNKKTTELQQASYHMHLFDLVHSDNVTEFAKLIEAGLSPNPCNPYGGESLVHLICQLGKPDFLRVLLRAGATVQVADDYGRTPLHDACRAVTPCFDIVTMLLQADYRMTHMTDCRGAVPLSYVPKEHYDQWIAFFEEQKDLLWPMTSSSTTTPSQTTLIVQHMACNSRPVPNPENALTATLAQLVASGEMPPEEARFLMYTTEDDPARCLQSDRPSDLDKSDHQTNAGSSNMDKNLPMEDDLSEVMIDEMADILEQLECE